jgi:hypothetical protein
MSLCLVLALVGGYALMWYFYEILKSPAQIVANILKDVFASKSRSLAEKYGEWAGKQLIVVLDFSPDFSCLFCSHHRSNRWHWQAVCTGTCTTRHEHRSHLANRVKIDDGDEGNW